MVPKKLVLARLGLVMDQENAGWFYLAIKLLGAVLVTAAIHYAHPIV